MFIIYVIDLSTKKGKNGRFIFLQKSEKQTVANTKKNVLSYFISGIPNFSYMFFFFFFRKFLIFCRRIPLKFSACLFQNFRRCVECICEGAF